MTTTPVGTINIYSVRFDAQGFDNFIQQNRYVVLLSHFYLSFFPSAITFFAMLLNASGEIESKSWWYLLLSQISILLTAATSTISFSKPACSFRLGGTSNRPAASGSTIVAPFKKYRRNSLTFGSKSFSLLISAKSGSQLFI